MLSLLEKLFNISFITKETKLNETVYSAKKGTVMTLDEIKNQINVIKGQVADVIDKLVSGKSKITQTDITMITKLKELSDSLKIYIVDQKKRALDYILSDESVKDKSEMKKKVSEGYDKIKKDINELVTKLNKILIKISNKVEVDKEDIEVLKTLKNNFGDMAKSISTIKKEIFSGMKE